MNKLEKIIAQLIVVALWMAIAYVAGTITWHKISALPWAVIVQRREKWFWFAMLTANVIVFALRTWTIYLHQRAGSRFFKLPPKVQTQIFEYVLGGNKFRVRGSVKPPPNYLALFLVNKKISMDTALIPYRTNTFSDSCANGFVEFVKNRTEAQLEAINSVEIITVASERPRALDPKHMLTARGLDALAKMNVSEIYVTDLSLGIVPDEKVKAGLKEMAPMLRGRFPGANIVYTRPKSWESTPSRWYM